MKNGILVGMSGGVDSSVAAYLLKQSGYIPIGLTLKIWNAKGEKEFEVAKKANRICDILKIQFKMADVEQEFKNTIVNDFINGYFSGTTPNPCVLCNPIIKFHKLFEIAREMNIEKIATGHYSRVFYNQENNRFVLKKGKDLKKDQSYFLWQLPQKYLSVINFPLGEISKEEVKKNAVEQGLIFGKIKESQDICFIPNNNYREFLKEYCPDQIQSIKEGDIVDESGKVLGKHNGYYNFTIGQRKGFGIGFGEPKYVKKIDSINNRIIICGKNNRQNSGLVLTNINWVSLEKQEKIEGIIHIRYNHKGVKCRAKYFGNKMIVHFEEPQNSVAPGQSAVLYQNDMLIFGGIIEDSL